LRKKIRIEFRADKNLPKLIMIDEARFAQIIFNLLSNAIKFTDEGTVTVFVRYQFDEESVPEDYKGMMPVLCPLDEGISNRLLYVPNYTESDSDS
jgi:signal transduction histidine kinase